MVSNIISNRFIRKLTDLPTKTLFYNLKTDEVMKNVPSHLVEANFIYSFKIPKEYNQLQDYKYFDSAYKNVAWKDVFGGNRRCMQWLSSPSEFVEDYFTRVGANPTHFLKLLEYPISYVLPLFKQIKIYCHHNYDLFGSALRYFVDLDALSGIPPGKFRSLGDNPQLWLTDLVASHFDQQFWFEQFLETFSKFTINLPANILSLEEFTINRWLWVTSGASSFSLLQLDNQVVKTKFGAAVSRTNEELLKFVNDARSGQNIDQMIKVFVKPDEASFKRRLIANVPLGGYIIAAYIRYLLSLFLGLEPQFEKLNVFPNDAVDVINLLREGRVAYPLDESAYDYHVTRESWLGFFQFLETVFPDNDGVAAFKSYFDHAIWIFENKRGRWLKGMPSGLALTTLVNSWMNYIKQNYIIPGDIHWACGDDVLTFPYKQTTLADVEAQYAKFGSEANAAKNWTSTKFCEYLKVLYGRFGTSGYPARVYGSLLYNVEPPPSTPIEKLYELVDLWKLYFDRCGLHMDENLVGRDLAMAVSRRIPNFTKQLAIEWMHSPKIHGGFGKLPYNNKTFTWKIESKEISTYTLNRYRLPRVVQHVGKVELEVGTYRLTQAKFKFGPSYQMPPVETEDDWVKRLNREDLPDRGPYTSMVLDQVPLPVIDFVSVSNMSKFAKTNAFNTYPNLTGNWNSISSRLVSGSLQLVEYVLDFMELHKLSFLI